MYLGLKNKKRKGLAKILLDFTELKVLEQFLYLCPYTMAKKLQMTWKDNKNDRWKSKQYAAYARLLLMEIVISSISFSLRKENRITYTTPL